MEEAPSLWMRLAKALCGPQPKISSSPDAPFVKGDVLDLGEDKVLNTSKVWVSPQYASLAALIQEIKGGKSEMPQFDNFHLIGTAGTGKSSFGILWLYAQAKRQARAVYRNENHEFLYFDFSSPEEPVVKMAASMMSFYKYVDKETWVIIDGPSSPIICDGPILQCVSDTKSHHHAFAKRGCYLYMEAWGLEDCEECAEAISLNITNMPERYYYCGGVPRLLFKWDAAQLQNIANTAFAKISNVPAFEHALKNPDTINEFSDKVFHYKYPDASPVWQAGPALRHIVPASAYIALKADQLFKLDDDAG